MGNLNGPTQKRSSTRSSIITAAARILREQGPVAVTTRRVAEQAGVQAPAIYRLFGDKDGLLDAVAEHVMAEYAAAKATIVEAAAADSVDPLDDLRAGWQSQVTFGVANPTLFWLFSDPTRVARSPGAALGRRLLEERVRRVAATGRLRVSESRATAMIQAACIGAIQTILATPVQDRDPDLPEAMYDAVLAQILTDTSHPVHDGPTAAAVTLRAVAPSLDMLSHAERQLLEDWLDRIIDTT